MIREHNKTLGVVLACWECEAVDNLQCLDHSPRVYMTHFKKDGKWYNGPERYIHKVLELLDVDEALNINGCMNTPSPERINNLTDLLTFFKVQGISDDELGKHFPSTQVDRMRGRVLKQLVKGKR